MNSLPTQALSVAAMAILAVIVSVSLSPLAAAIFSVSIACAVAFVAHSRHLQDQQRLVYRPVHIRSQSVQRRVRSDD